MKRNIIHMDIKPPNFILIKGQLKVIDLGCAEEIPPGQDFVLSNSSKGTEGYMAPECFVTYKNKLFQYSTRYQKYSLLIYLCQRLRLQNRFIFTWNCSDVLENKNQEQ